jgi:hypothetical protein
MESVDKRVSNEKNEKLNRPSSKMTLLQKKESSRLFNEILDLYSRNIILCKF